jgi:hypothetical protein
MWTGERVNKKRIVVYLFFILAEIVKSDRFSCFLRVEPSFCEFDRV